MEKSYFEIKITFVHIVVLLIAVVAIGILLFYMGYRAGYKVEKTLPATGGTPQQKAENAATLPEELKIVDEKQVAVPKNPPSQGQSIAQEMKLHQSTIPAKAEKEKKEAATPTAHYLIQVGAFASYGNAKTYAEKFRNLGYATEIASPDVKTNNKLYRVRIGHFTDLEQAKREKEKLEKMEKKKFSIAPSR